MQRQCQLPSLQARDQPQREKPLLTRDRLFLMLQTRPLPLSESPRGISITTKGSTDSFLAGRASPSPWIPKPSLPGSAAPGLSVLLGTVSHMMAHPAKHTVVKVCPEGWESQGKDLWPSCLDTVHQTASKVPKKTWAQHLIK